MLERASTCLETSGRQLFRAPKRCLRTRRMLHSSFWHHGASDLILPVWWASAPILHDGSGDAASTARHHDGPLLDFLYPEKTLALIRRMSSYGKESRDARRRPMHGSRVRQYSTAQGLPGEDDGVADLELVEAREEMEDILLRTTADLALKEIVEYNTPGKQLLALELYTEIAGKGPHVEPGMQTKLLRYLANGGMSRIASRVLPIFDSTPVSNRQPSSYRAAIAAYIALKMVGPAIQLFEEAAMRFNEPRLGDELQIGTDIVLGLTVQDDQWDLSLRVFRTFLRQAASLGLDVRSWTYEGNRIEFKTIWGQVADLPDMVEHWQSLLDHVRQFRHELIQTREDKLSLRLFMTGFLPPVMNEVLHTPEPDEDYIWEFFVNIFSDLRSVDLVNGELYEYAIRTMITDIPRYQEYTNKPKLFFELYRQYRQQWAEGVKPRPSRNLIHRLMVQLGKNDGMGRIEQLVKDLRDMYPSSPLNFPTLAYLIHGHAKDGNADRVHEYLNIMLSKYQDQVDLRHLQALLYVYARRIDVPGTIEQFKRINTEFGRIPDIACWNTLLLAFTRADDLDGALECFNNCLESGITPDVYTFGPMLDLCAKRGDVEAFEALFSRAKQLKVPVETDVRARSGYIQAFLNAGDPEGAEAILNGMVQDWHAGILRGHALTHSWNLVLSWYGVQNELEKSRRVYKQMVDLNIPLDTWTYASLMRALVSAHQTDAAYKILRVTMPLNKIRSYAFHYAIVITGFLNERQYHKAKKAHQRMKIRKLKQTPSSRQASLLTVGVEELRKLREQRVEDPKVRLIEVEQQLRESLMGDYGMENAHDQPSHRRYIDSPELSNIPESYFALVIMLYTTRGAYDICKQLFETASKSKSANDPYEAPIALLTAIMETHWRAKEYADVERCWELARSEANRLVKTFQQAMHPEPPAPEFDSITDPQVRERFESSRIATNRRQILFKASRIYIRSLLEQPDPNAIQVAQRTILSLLTHGFIIDNLTWNEYIRTLALRGHLIDAFSACETYLMPQFPGWAVLNPTYIRKFRQGYPWIEVRYFDIKKQSILPRYKTVVVLAAAWAQVKRDEANGLGYNPTLGRWAREVLEQVAPNTLRAIETMPRTGDRLQELFLKDT
ncbi:hypothetical protein K458DRAFT_418425 [Lentithecium fluviatile CBS 122367]|uniref:TPR-like protein n=1 Tax=Lentithecium fluviatile CBS 122367 TaxID=1168545 RepID=A0A6G1J1T2_9PLEO|nr:hypothetical protein K458DRAFT_418425 [Lentithecium fluviatile CBS 122367]